MGFPLGVAIAELFANIARLLRGQPYGDDVIPVPPGGWPTPPPTGPPGSGGGPGSTPPPIVRPPDSPFPPPVVEVPPVVPTPPPVVQPDPCPQISYADRLALYALQFRTPRSQTSPFTPSPGVSIEDSDDMGVMGLGIPVDDNDYFRFRAISTANNVPVSFFGRIRVSRDNYVPFNHTLNTSTANTVFQTITRTGPGLLLGAAASVPVGSITSGAVNAIGEIGRLAGATFTPHTVLFSGQLDDQHGLSSTLASPAIPTNNPTFIRVVQASISDDFNTVLITPNAGKRVRIIAANCTYECSGVAGNRIVTLWFEIGGFIQWEAIVDEAGIASQDLVLRSGIGSQSKSSTAVLPAGFRQFNMALPELLYFTTPVTVLFGAYGVQAGDEAQSLRVIYEET